ncbi:uncharacterized protein LOC119957525 isoform X2 [Scyliorhinus canicula]|uniref:uncharacterized protein LOC119957525 isoform X2 n=1 Tax=Scyliorhinus canicula TaxID=7830 RepID=UPI0018F6A655|nr:uncharacterized protein LOC119957525 isoform X2 [Scyliorhinus canicula]
MDERLSAIEWNNTAMHFRRQIPPNYGTLDVFHNIEQIYFPILAAIGVIGNALTIAILYREKCDLSKHVTRYLMAMTVADLLQRITEFQGAQH